MAGMDPDEWVEVIRSALEEERNEKRRLVAAATSWSRLASSDDNTDPSQIMAEAACIECEFEPAEMATALGSAVSLVLDAVRLWAMDTGRSPGECLQKLALALEMPGGVP